MRQTSLSPRAMADKFAGQSTLRRKVDLLISDSFDHAQDGY